MVKRKRRKIFTKNINYADFRGTKVGVGFLKSDNPISVSEHGNDRSVFHNSVNV